MAPARCAIPGVGDINAELLYQWGFRSAEQLAETEEEALEIDGISPERAQTLAPPGYTAELGWYLLEKR